MRKDLNKRKLVKEHQIKKKRAQIKKWSKLERGVKAKRCKTKGHKTKTECNA